MEELAIYLLKSSLCSAVFFSVYWCFFKNETFYHFNRYFLLAGLIASVIVPFFTYTYEVNIISGGNTSLSAQVIQPTTPDTSHVWFYILLSAYVIISCVLFIRHIVGLNNIKRVINRHNYISFKGYKLVTTPVFKSSFSIFDYIIIDNSSAISDTEKKLILEHELAHVKQFHWIDLLASQLFCSIEWFNPFAWLYLAAIRQNHEYLADHTVLEKGNPIAVYRAALINHSLGVPVFTFASSFSRHDQLRRITMMMQPASGSMKKMAAVIVLPALAFFFWAFAKPKINLITPEASTIVKQPGTIIKPEKTVADKKQMPEPVKVRSASRAPVHKHKIKVETPAVAPDPETVRSEKTPSSEMKMDAPKPIYYLDGEEVSSWDVIAPKDIKVVNVYKGQQAIAIYGEKGKNGVVSIISKKSVQLP